MSRIRGTIDGRQVNLHKTSCLSGCGTLLLALLVLFLIATAAARSGTPVHTISCHNPAGCTVHGG